jgi:hypothetical protein
MATSPESTIISSLTQHDASVDVAIQQLLILTSAAESSTTTPRDSSNSPLSTHLGNVWRSLVEDVVANTAPSQQAVLVEFVRALRLQKVVNPTTGSQLQYDLVPGCRLSVWTELPLFGISVRDEWNFGKILNPHLSSAHINHLTDATSCTPEEEACYYNKLVFLAQLTNLPENNMLDPEVNPGPYDFSVYALWDLRDAFEKAANIEATSITLLCAASLWIIYCADRLWSNVQAKRSFVHKGSGTNSAEAGEQYLKYKKEWTGFNAERWKVWINGLEMAREVQDKNARQLVARALKEVERAEDQSWRITEDEKFK